MPVGKPGLMSLTYVKPRPTLFEMLLEVRHRDFADLVRGSPDEFLVIFAPFTSWGRNSFSAAILRRRIGLFRKAVYTYTLTGPKPSRVKLSTSDLSRSEVVDRMASDNLQHNEGRNCWVEY